MFRFKYHTVERQVYCMALEGSQCVNFKSMTPAMIVKVSYSLF